MVSRKTRTAFIIVLAAMAAISCKDDEESTSYPSLNGMVSISGLDPFISYNKGTREMTASGAEHPEGKNDQIEYSWSVSPSEDEEEDEDDGTPQTEHFSYNFCEDTDNPDLRTYTVTCSASAEGYYGISGSRTTTVVKTGLDGNGSIRFYRQTGNETVPDLGIEDLGISSLASFADTRTDDGQEAKTYYYTTIGDLDWFVQNLSYRVADRSVDGKTVPQCLSYANSEAMTDIYGLYYTYEAAVAEGTCPDGWRLPTETEWDACFGTGEFKSGDLMVKAEFNGERMWEYWPQVTITDEPVFCALPTGYANIVTGTFKDAFDIRYSDSSVTTRAVFWVKAADGTEDAVYKYIVEDQPVYEGEDGETLPLDKKTGIYTGYADRTSFGASIRCVREHTDGN